MATPNALLFTPGPLTTSATVKAALVRDLGSRDSTFMEAVADVRRRLTTLATARAGEYTTILMQGAGTMGIEAMIGTCVPRGRRLLVAINGAYGRRIAHIARTLGIDVVTVEDPEDRPTDVGAVERALMADATLTHVAAVHCETTTGILNPVERLGEVAARHGRSFLVDAMSSFGAVPLDVADAHVDALVSSSNKCIEGVPGFSFCVARRSSLAGWRGQARSVALDLHAQWAELERSGQFRFTPPVQVILAFRQALLELAAEGGVRGRMARYRENHATLVEGMRTLGFREYLAPELQGWIITTFRTPADPAFRFEEFYARLAEQGLVIYPGKLTHADCFRIGTIGRLYPDDVRRLLAAIADAAREMGFRPDAG
jgi:2-aminoethylphosphonate-pyruvate transaminase